MIVIILFTFTRVCLGITQCLGNYRSSDDVAGKNKGDFRSDLANYKTI